MMRALAACAASLALAGCASPVLVVEVDGLPDGAVTLVPVAVLDGAAASERPAIAVSAARPITFGLRLPSGSDGKTVSVAVGAFDARNCLVGAGETKATVGGAVAKVALGAAQGCGGMQSPPSPPEIVLLGASPSSVASAGGDAVALRGFGFAPGAAVSVASLDGKKQAGPVAATAVDALSLTFAAPALLTIGRVRVTVTNPDGKSAARDDLLSYVATTIRFKQAAAPNFFNASSAIAVGDVNGDGAPDVISGTYDQTRNRVEVLLNNGDGTFPPAPTGSYDVPLPPQGFALGDFDGDGTLDVAVACQSGAGGNGSIALLMGKKDAPGTFAAAPTIASGQNTFAIAAADLDLDGVPDLAVGAADALNIYLTRGGVPTLAHAPYPAGVLPTVVVAGDFDGDGAPDLASISRYGGSTGAGAVRVFRNANVGHNGQLAPTSDSYDVGGDDPEGLAAGDLDGDGHLDLAVASFSDDAGWILVGKGDGTFAAATRIAIGHYTAGVTVGDFDGSGHPAAAFTNTGLSGNMDLVTLVRVAGAPMTIAGIPVTVGSGPQFIAVADFDRDGRLDFVYSDHNDSALEIWLNDSQ